MGQTAEVLRKAITAMVSGDMDTLAPLLAEDIQVHLPGSNQLSGTYKSRSELLEGFLGKVMALTGGQFTLEPHAFLDGDDHGVGVYNVKGTRDGKTIEWRQVNVYHVRNGQIAEAFVNIHEFEAWNAFWQ